MWRIFLTLTLANACLALPSPQQNNGNLDGLISNVFGPAPDAVPNTAPQTQTTPSAVNKPAENLNLDALISSAYPELYTTSPINLLDTQNNSRPQGCKCVPYYMCRHGTIIVDGVGIIDLRTGYSACESYNEVCCKIPDTVKIQDKVTPPPLEKKGCGNRHPRGIGPRIAGDTNNEAEFAEFPWMVAILKKLTIEEENKTLNVYQCGGSLIHKQAVLTAAHCVYGKQPSELRIRAGEWDTQSELEIYPHQNREVQSVIIHEKYDTQAQFFDVAILILSEPVNDAENVDVICLSEQNEVYDRSRCFASGWGKDKFGKKGLYQVILKKIDLPIVPRDTCQDRLRKTPLGEYFILHESFICAGGEIGKDTCTGDGGSPLVCPSKNDPIRYQQAGIVSWGIGCGEDGTPGVYANVAHVRDWIDQKMAFNNLDNIDYKL